MGKKKTGSRRRPSPVGRNGKLRTAAIGDSLTQGFMSGAVFRTDVSWPALVARTLGLHVPLDYRVPHFPGSGLPLNLEDFLRDLSLTLGNHASVMDWVVRFPVLVSQYVDRVEDLYERGAGAAPAKFGGVYNNLAVWGFTVNDAIQVTSDLCDQYIADAEGWIDDDFLGLPSAPMYRTARRVLNPKGDPKRGKDTQVGALRRLVESEGGVDVLFLCLGANDALGTVLALKLNDMEDATGAIPSDSVERAQWNLTSEAQFAADYAALAQEIGDALSKSDVETMVFVGTVPHVTIPPVTTGIGTFDGRYFDYYARFFMHEGNFSPLLHSKLTRDEAKKIDTRIDAFNAVICREATAGRRGWHVVDLCTILDSLAVRRHRRDESPGQALRNYYASKDPPITDHPLLRLDPIPSILKLETTEDGRRTAGGLMSLDGVHPSTIGYGIVAEAFLEAMHGAGFKQADPRRLNWASIIAHDTLLQAPPTLWDDVLEAGSGNANLWDVIFRAFAG